MQKSDYSSKRVQDFPEIDAESSCLGFGPVLVVVGWISSGIPPIITLNKIMMMVSMMRMVLMMRMAMRISSVSPSSYIKLPGTHPELAVADLPVLIPVHRLDHVIDFSKSNLLKQDPRRGKKLRSCIMRGTWGV